jgi:hypothetical protein
MQIHNLLSKLDAIENSPRKSIFESIGQGDQYFSTWEREIHPTLCEVALAPDQIQQLFKDIEKGAGRSALGKAGDAVKGAKDKISDAWFNKFGGMLQSSAPVQAFDQKFEDIKSKIAAKNPELAAKLAKYGEFAKNNPNLHKFLLAIAGSAAAALGVAVAGGIGAGALAVGTGTGIAVGILNIADRLLQGQKASTAIGRGATAGLVAGITAAGAAKLADLAKGMSAQIGVMKGAGEGVEQLNIVRDSVGVAGMPGFERGIQIAGKTEDVAKLRDLWNQFGKLAWDYKPGTDPSAMYGPYKEFAGLVAKMKDPAYIDGLQLVAAQQQQAIQWVNNAFTAINGAANIAASAGAATAGQAASGAGEKTAAAPTTESLNRSQLNELFGITGNKVDASKLQKAWEKAGSPTDSEEVAKILQSAGVDPAVISQVYTNMSLPAPASAAAPTATSSVNTQDLLAQIMKLTPAEQKQVLAHLKK